jgi:hypothetical protein
MTQMVYGKKYFILNMERNICMMSEYRWELETSWVKKEDLMTLRMLFGI